MKVEFKIRVGLKFDKVYRNICDFIKMRDHFCDGWHLKV